MEKLTLGWFSISEFEQSFQDIRITSLKYLHLENVPYAFEDDDDGVDVSQEINGFFSSCSFPNLEEFHFLLFEEYVSDDDVPIAKWTQVPNISASALVDSFPKLKKLHLGHMHFSRDVAAFLGNFRSRECAIFLKYCIVDITPITPERQAILDKLKLDAQDWVDFCDSFTSSLRNDYICWNVIGDAQFLRMAYAKALMKVADTEKLANFLELVETEAEGSVVTNAAFQTLKRLETRSNNFSTHGECLGVVRVALEWDKRKVLNLIDYGDEPEIN